MAERETLLLELVHHGVDDEADAEPERAVEERRTGAHERTDVDQKLLRQRDVPDVPLAELLHLLDQHLQLIEHIVSHLYFFIILFYF
jgi:hypothetical protein